MPEGGSGGEHVFQQISEIRSAPPHSGGEHLLIWVGLGGSRWLGSRIRKMFPCDALKSLTKYLWRALKSQNFRACGEPTAPYDFSEVILLYKMIVTGGNFAVSKGYWGDITLQNNRRK